MKKLSANFNKNKNLKQKMISEIKRHHHHHHHKQQQRHNFTEQTDDQKLSNHQDSQNLNNEDESETNGASGHRLSHKEDDLLRKQRLKGNLNALLRG